MVVWAACVVLGSNPVRNNSKEPYQPSLVQWRKDITELQRAAVREANDLKRKQTTAQRDTKKKPNTLHDMHERQVISDLQFTQWSDWACEHVTSMCS